MKNLFIAALFLVTLASCEVNYIEPRYDSRDRITGSYDIEEYSDTNNEYHYYRMSITKASGYDKIYINNFYDANISVYAYFNDNKITIPYQVIDGFEVEGTGTLFNSDFSISYRVKDRYNNYPSDFGDMYGSNGY
jgi:hypothetical protein